MMSPQCKSGCVHLESGISSVCVFLICSTYPVMGVGQRNAFLWSRPQLTHFLCNVTLFTKQEEYGY